MRILHSDGMDSKEIVSVAICMSFVFISRQEACDYMILLLCLRFDNINIYSERVSIWLISYADLRERSVLYGSRVLRRLLAR